MTKNNLGLHALTSIKKTNKDESTGKKLCCNSHLMTSKWNY